MLLVGAVSITTMSVPAARNAASMASPSARALTEIECRLGEVCVHMHISPRTRTPEHRSGRPKRTIDSGCVRAGARELLASYPRQVLSASEPVDGVRAPPI